VFLSGKDGFRICPVLNDLNQAGVFGRACCLFLYPGKLLLVSGMQSRNIKAPNKTGKQLLQINQKIRKGVLLCRMIRAFNNSIRFVNRFWLGSDPGRSVGLRLPVYLSR